MFLVVASPRPVHPSIRRAFEVFAKPARSVRLLELIDAGTSRSHRKLIGLLPHALEGTFDRRWATVFPRSVDARNEVLRVVQQLRLPGECAVLSEQRDLDGVVMAFADLWATSDGSGFGVFGVLDAEHLAFHQGEAPHSTVVLLKP